MAEFRLGRVVFSDRGYMVAELLAGGADEGVLTGYSLIGPQASASIIYTTTAEALEALQDIEARVPFDPGLLGVGEH
jgi:hypothetical protein